MYAPKDYSLRFTQKVVETGDSSSWWYGTGISPVAHPLANVVPMNKYCCEGCGFRPPYMKVVAASYTMSPVSGDECWAFEFKCDGCGKYNALTDKG